MSKGYTLVELLIVITIIAVLAAVAIPKLQDKSAQSQEAKARADLHLIRDAFQRIQFDTGLFPVKIADLDNSNPPPKGRRFNGNNWLEPAMPGTWSGPYLSAAPICPLSGYQYSLRWTRRGTVDVRISVRADEDDEDEDDSEAGNPYIRW